LEAGDNLVTLRCSSLLDDRLVAVVFVGTAS
jgi:hypothetical protein